MLIAEYRTVAGIRCLDCYFGIHLWCIEVVSIKKQGISRSAEIGDQVINQAQKLDRILKVRQTTKNQEMMLEAWNDYFGD